jgi:hypothetical protein
MASLFLSVQTLKMGIAKSLPATEKETTPESFSWVLANSATVFTSLASKVPSSKSPRSAA